MKHAGDPFERLYNENYHQVCQLLTRFVGPQKAEDLAFGEMLRRRLGFTESRRMPLQAIPGALLCHRA